MNIDDYPKHTQRRTDVFVMHVPVISSSHITAQDGRILTEAPEDVEGHLCRLGDTGDILVMDEENKNLITEWQQAGLSSAFIDLMLRMRGLGYCYVRIDADGDVLDGLPTFEW